MLGQVTLDLLPDDWDLGEEVDTTLNGPYLDISESDEAELIPLFTEVGGFGKSSTRWRTATNERPPRTPGGA
jgi:hypothetical protein